MRKYFLSIMVLPFLADAALAGNAVTLSDSQLDRVAAGCVGMLARGYVPGPDCGGVYVGNPPVTSVSDISSFFAKSSASLNLKPIVSIANTANNSISLIP